MLSEVKIRNQKPGLRPIRLYDGLKDGLYLDVRPSGRKFWRVQYSFGGKRSQKTLGEWPTLGLKEARKSAERFKGGVRSGKVPREDGAETFEAVSEEWAVKFFPALTSREVARRRQFMEKRFFPAVGKMQIGSITPLDVLDRILRPIETKGALETVRRARTYLSQIFRYAVANGLAERDVTRDLIGAIPPPIVTHRPAILEPDAVGRLLYAIDSYNGSPSVSFALKILPYVFVRPGELRNAEWADVNVTDATWRIPALRMKMRTAHIVPLSRQV
ncbi:MAG: integrase arm-type DNA-binding domain-containing protein, partial [Deltaproteobacteria bacterium]|nr:integrase arm-type DNA-binding domain-containing protein [Deltaproteobacteria bacterium]